MISRIDVSSLYTNIPHDEDKQAVISKLKSMENPGPYQSPPEIIGELVDVVLHKNVFEFDDKFYLQI